MVAPYKVAVVNLVHFMKMTTPFSGILSVNADTQWQSCALINLWGIGFIHFPRLLNNAICSALIILIKAGHDL